MTIYEAKRALRRSTLSIRGVDYSVCEWGDADAPTIFVLHGWGDAAATFQFFADVLPGRHVVAPDWRGFGETRLHSSSYWFPDYLADLDGLLEAYSSSAPVAILGHSMGGNVASLYAGSMPERVSHLVNVEGFGLRERDPADAPANYRRWLELSRDGCSYRDFASFAELEARISRRSPHMSAAQAAFVARAWGEQQTDGRVTIKADPAHKLPNPILYRRAEAEACWREISAKILVVSGAQSDFKTGAASWLESGVENLALPGARHIEVADAGHMIHFEQPGALALAVEHFLATD